MPRHIRQNHAGAFHHVINRGAGRRDVFPTDHLRFAFIELLAESMIRHSLRVHAYCLMTNHFHLLVESVNPALSAAMRDLTSRFTRIFNSRTSSDGPIFRGRYGSISVDDDRSLLQVSRYIHLNPVEAGLCRSATEWPWSSAAAYVGRALEPKWLTTRLILSLFSPNAYRQSYSEFIEAGLDPSTRDFYQRPHLPARFSSGSTEVPGST